MRARGGSRLLVVLMVWSLTAIAVPAVANAAGSGGDRTVSAAFDTVTVGGYDDYQIDRTVDVVNGSTGNNLVFWFTAGRALSVGSLTIDLPAGTWVTPLHLAAGRLVPGDAGAVGARPQPPDLPGTGDPAQYCSRGGAVDPQTHARDDLSVVDTASVHRIVINFLSCAPGQRIAIRIVGLTAPRTGLYRFPVRLTDAADPRPRWVADPWLLVRPTPRVQLAIQMPPSPIDAQAGMVPAPVRVRVLTAAGRPVSTYSGTIRLYTDPVDCAVGNKGYQDYPVSPSRDGSYRLDVPFQQAGTYALIAEDVDHRAVSARSHEFAVIDGTRDPVCPASYH